MLQKTAKITSKRQLTIPVVLFKRARLQENQRVLIRELNGELRIISSLSLIDSLAGSVSTPRRFVGLSPDEIIFKAKKEYFSQSAKK